MESDSTKKPFYRNTDDTLEDVGITRRQLGHWRKAGLFEPELGPRTKYFTKADTEQLQFLKSLIHELKLPVEKVNQLITSARVDWRGSARYATFIDIENMQLMTPIAAVNQMIGDTLTDTSYDPSAMQRWFEAIALRIFQYWALTSNTFVYEAHMKNLLDKLARIDRMARMQEYRELDPETGAPTFRFSPARENDPDLTLEGIERLLAERDRLDHTTWAYR
jgi:DNA-binding transcriptional MerR regulator